MKQFGVDALVASTPENATCVAGTVGWSTEVYVYSAHIFAVFPRDPGTAPVLVVPGQEVTCALMQQSRIKDLYTFAGRSAPIIPPGSGPRTPEEET